MPVTQAAVITEDIVNNSKVGEKVDNKAEKKVKIGANINTVLRPYLLTNYLFIRFLIEYKNRKSFKTSLRRVYALNRTYSV
jgi:hypothetical protein